MTEAQHTPGPWEIGNAANCTKDHAVTAGAFVVARVVESRGEHINGNTRPFDHGSANARLIAAAPDMLAALRRAEQTTEELCQGQDDPNDECWNVLREIRAAIAKAEGRT